MIKYALDLIDGEAKLGHLVSILVPGRFTCFNRDTTKIIKSWNSIDIYNILNPLPVSMGKKLDNMELLCQEGNEVVYTDFLRIITPDIIHIHSFMGLHKAFLKASKKLGIPIVYTTHDYYGICPKTILLNNNTQCMVTDGSQCTGCMETSVSVRKIMREQSALYKILKNNPVINWLEYSQRLVPLKIYIRSHISKSRKNNTSVNCNNDAQEYIKLKQYYNDMFKYVTTFHFNSNQSKEIYTQHLGNISGQVIPISNKNIKDNRMRHEYGKILRIGFIGNGRHKGFDILKEALDDMYTQGMRNIECHIYFNPKEKMLPYIVSHEPYKENDTDRIYNNMDILVLPSLWKETYGMVVLEAISYGVPVIVSENVGAKELLCNNDKAGLVIKPTKKALYEALKTIYCRRELLNKMNEAICDWNIDLSYESHVQNIMKLYKVVR
jgi:glycosyltransferase involved in cell wall biosynthesis